MSTIRHTPAPPAARPKSSNGATARRQAREAAAPGADTAAEPLGFGPDVATHDRLVARLASLEKAARMLRGPLS